jgi:neutral ceramidase
MSEVLAGVAEVDITPPIGHRMAGHFYEVPSEGVHDPLRAKAIVLEQGNQKFAMAFADVVSMVPDVSQEARQRFSQLAGLPVSNIMIAATHSHTGPLFGNVARDFFHERALAEHGRDDREQVDYSEFLTTRVVEALKNANSSLRPAELSFVSQHQGGISFNRRYHMNNGLVRFNPGQGNPDIVKPAGPIDPEVSSLMFSDIARGQFLGGLTVFACHTDTLGGTQYGADYPFFIQEQLRERFGPDFVSAFALGTAGDINHIDVSKNGPRKGLEVTEGIGRTIGEAVVRKFSGSSLVQDPSLAVLTRTLQIPLQKPTITQLRKAEKNLPLLGQKDVDFMDVVDAVKTLTLQERGRSWRAEVQVLRIDQETAFVGLPGEIFADLGLDIKEKSPFDNTIVASLANDGLSYIPTQKAFAEGSYEVTNSCVIPGSGEQLAEAAVELLEEAQAK